jgi:alpha-galactosidase
MGWNTWCTEGSCGRDFCNAQEVMAVADAMTTNGMKDVGFQYINLDGMGN